MNIFYYLLGGIVFIIFKILYDIFLNSGRGGLVLNWTELLGYGVLGLLAALAFFIADYSLFKKKG